MGSAVIAALLLNGCADGRAPRPVDSAAATPVEVSGYGTERREGRLVFSAEYTIRNTTRAPVAYKIAFAFLDGDGLASDLKWVSRTVLAGHVDDGTVWIPWEGRQGTGGVAVTEVHQTPL
ncbi:hypothetical protein CTZ28_45165 [Streptomyces shenzhenensis]|uniref:DUF3426 domain-containing protein n=2 Tax=Streptomyces shenzhenensis TaxID=943815 RepID=A0A3M0HTW0_9ACTN|nr:hypothetical protein CTZ28_45165 [Streptomyces shenzhenensis]